METDDNILFHKIYIVSFDERKIIFDVWLPKTKHSGQHS